MRRLAAWALVAASCGPGGHPTYSATFTDRGIRIESYARAFRYAEPSLVLALQGDARLHARIRPEVATELVDPFMFSDRQSALEAARSDFERVALPSDAALKAEVLGARAEGQPVPDEPLLAQVKLEQEAFRRLLDSEDARLERERTLPRGAVDLVRALELGWPLSPRGGASANAETTIAWRFGNLEESLLPGSLSVAERDDLEGALLPLAPRALGMPKAAAGLRSLGRALERMWAAPYALEDEEDMDHALGVYVGSPLAFDALDGAFEAAQGAFATQASVGLSVVDARAAASVYDRARRAFFSAPACLPRMPVRTPLDMAPPPERAWACSLLHALDDVRTDLDELAADVAWHDAVVVARWAVATHGPVRSIDAARHRARPMLPLSEAEVSRLLLVARAEPMKAIAVGVAASILMQKGPVHARERAHRWRGVGEAPMDLVEPLLP